MTNDTIEVSGMGIRISDQSGRTTYLYAGSTTPNKREAIAILLGKAKIKITSWKIRPYYHPLVLTSKTSGLKEVVDVVLRTRITKKDLKVLARKSFKGSLEYLAIKKLVSL